MRFIFPTILILAAIASFVLFTDPLYKQVKELRAESASYSTALDNSQKLQTERDQLSSKYRALPPEEVARLSKLLPDTADNIHLIIDMQRIAQSYGMSVSGIKFDSDQAAAGTPVSTVAAANTANLKQATQDYGTFRLSFVTSASYDNFVKFVKDLETSLRLTDIESVAFSSTDSSTQTYTYTIKLKTYWLKSS